MMQDFQPSRGGQLVLWHGEAGTGKTFALRALAWEWREWCQFHYIVDPDAFFGERADYLISVLLQPVVPMMLGQAGFGMQHVFTGYADFDEPDEAPEAEKPWRLLVLEDTGELLSADARERAGQGLSRFLNVVDGLIGQGLRVLVLVTTNEEIRRLHPAVARPGRCAANVEFGQLDADEADAWLERHDLERKDRGSRTLASLYAQLEGRDPTETVLVGFGE
jgi:SpoVK/Ycf46/Vps4 family AAA+-type ATPase